MTVKIEAGKRKWGIEIAGGLNFTPTRGLPGAVGALYSESVTGAHPRFLGDLVGGLIEKVLTGIGKKADEAFGGSRARVIEPYAFGESGIGQGYERGIGDSELLGGYGYVPGYVKPAEQGWLQRTVGKVGQYVAGAYVPTGVHVGIYIDGDLLKRGAEYVRHAASGVTGKVREAGRYAGHFIETLLTRYHEEAHAEGIESEPQAERYAEIRLSELVPRDPFVRRALHEYTGGGRYRGGLQLQPAYATVPA